MFNEKLDELATASKASKAAAKDYEDKYESLFGQPTDPVFFMIKNVTDQINAEFVEKPEVDPYACISHAKIEHKPTVSEIHAENNTYSTLSLHQVGQKKVYDGTSPHGCADLVDKKTE